MVGPWRISGAGCSSLSSFVGFDGGFLSPSSSDCAASDSLRSMKGFSTSISRLGTKLMAGNRCSGKLQLVFGVAGRRWQVAGGGWVVGKGGRGRR